nr:immunoglobulin light chain junction region [Macaca mulatta]
RMQSLEFPYSF